MRKDKKYLIILSSFIFVGCQPLAEYRVPQLVKNKIAPKTPIFEMKTGMTEKLSCMDDLFYTLHLPQVPIYVEEIENRVGGVKAGDRTMLISALNAMSKKSKALKVYTFGIRDTQNLLAMYQAAGRSDPFSYIPPYTIKGSLTQFDNGVASIDHNTGIGKTVFKTAKKTDGSQFNLVGESQEYYLSRGGRVGGTRAALDLFLVDSYSLTALPGIYANNSMVLLQKFVNTSADVVLKSLGANFSYTVVGGDAPAQAYRNLIELGAMEIIGKLFKIPFWTCLDFEEHTKQVRGVLSDWYYRLRDEKKHITYVKTYLKIMGKYKGDVSNELNDELVAVLGEYTKLPNSWLSETNNKVTLGIFQAALFDFMKWYKKALFDAKLDDDFQDKRILKPEYYKKLYSR